MLVLMMLVVLVRRVRARKNFLHCSIRVGAEGRSARLSFLDLYDKIFKGISSLSSSEASKEIEEERWEVSRRESLV